VTSEQALIRLYTQAAKRLRSQIAHALASNAIGTAAYRTAQLRAVQAELAQLGRKSRPLVLPIVFGNYVRGVDIVQIAQGIGRAEFEFTGIHTHAARVLADNLANSLEDAARLVGRRTDDAFRRVGLEVVAQVGVAEGDTRKAVSAELRRRLVDEGVTDAMTGFVDKAGRRWPLDTYTTMAARTTTREAMSAGTANRMADLGLDLVTISSHGTTCDICQAYEGNTYSLRGETPGYDVIDTLPPFHPNCWHVATPAGANLETLERALGVGIFTRQPVRA
jgi:hypothetical protein